MTTESHARWTTYLAKAKNGHDRPLGGSATKRVIRGHNGDVVLRLHATDVVTLHADGTETINTSGWKTVITSRFINEYSAARVYSVKGQWFVRVRNPEITPAKVWKHRACKGTGQVPTSCYGPSWCWAGCLGAACQHGQTTPHAGIECEHGQTARHALDPVKCWQCDGTGRYDYGSNEVHYAWDGGPLALDADGYAVGPGKHLTPVTVKTPKHSQHGSWFPGCDCPESGSVAHPSPGSAYTPPPATDYSHTGDALRGVLPGLRTEVTYPCDCTQHAVWTTSPLPVSELAIAPLDSMIIHLNDGHSWSREAIADWLDTLGVDLTFPVPDEIPAHIH